MVSAVMSTALPQAAYAASDSGGGGGKGIVDTVKGWFSDDDNDGKRELPAPPSHDEIGVADRQKLPKEKAQPPAKRVRELTGQRTASSRFWQLSDGRIEAELSAVPTSYRDAKTRAWKSIDLAVRASRTDGYVFANTTNSGRS
ncbi:hypothetical protein [Streptomyces sp. NPDC001978]|uniref:hypothetical protein n=1 Tax=Streptomyces sp. NPDC001978 TaxID=3364627 RepID=UPI00367D8FB2